MIIKITPQIEEMARTLCGEKEKTCARCDSFGLCEFWIEASIFHDAGYRKQEWISVEERLPKEGVRVLVWLKGDNSQYTSIDTDRLSLKKWVRWGRLVTHWMPLPEPPMEKYTEGET